MKNNPFSADVIPDWEGLVHCILRQETPQRVFFIELFLDPEVQTAICGRYELLDDLNPTDPFFDEKRQVIIQRFLGYDTVRGLLGDVEWSLKETSIEDTGDLRRSDGRCFMEEHKGPITNWEEFEAYPWPDPTSATSRSVEWYEANLPEDMCMVSSTAHFAEFLTWLMGYETLCYALYDQRDLVTAISQRILEYTKTEVEMLLQFDRVGIIWGSDDMGFRGGTLISPADLREFVLPGHRMVAEMVHQAGRPYLLHSCGNLRAIMEDLINDVGIDAIHSFEDTIIDVTEAKQQYGDRIALLGGIDVDFLCRASQEQVRARVRHTLEKCIPGGRYCLGTGNSVANYIPLDNYLAILDEGRKFTP